MNTSSECEFIGFVRGKEKHGESEYDPLGKTVTPLSNGKVITKLHLFEGIENLHEADKDFISKLARKIGNTTIGQAMCWQTLMEFVNEYWADVEERIEGKSS